VPGLLILGALSALFSAPPAVANVQLAYVAATGETGVKHQDDLMIRTARCQAAEAGRWACQIDFVRTAEPRGRLYFTLVTLEKRSDRWVLIGGLCRGPA
jgi:hypothetical protein